ncbi:TSUP family transporter [Thermanaerosceptrum fracticalcis]|uniref:Probable membrane transporter protein n=1 Tax=Thermanaerosceptrum fracticalcis TaxID=1712410 RepID=A0A7G6DYX1_THEFR|nr:sulfite exporter TauE/SafE family protein [Thermanaerosceptrum fracticalcis]QNB45025.1 TSUP family transporter [Thermanaerosceptrum fracticalcis]
MSPSIFALITLCLSFGFGVLGSLLGLGGGIFIVPILTIFLNVPIHYAIGASIISVIATSSGAAAAYVRDKITNIRIAMFLETATTTGAITGAYLSGVISSKVLYIIFSFIMLYSATMMFRKRNFELPQYDTGHPWAEKLKLNGAYLDNKLEQKVEYKTQGVPQGLGLMYIAGIISGLLGIGNGAFKVMAMDMAMRLPMKVSTATSNFMIGVTAAASAAVYFARGDINPLITAPVAIGVLLGATTGSKIMDKVKNSTLRKIFIPVLLLIAVQMFIKGMGVN